VVVDVVTDDFTDPLVSKSKLLSNLPLRRTLYVQPKDIQVTDPLITSVHGVTTYHLKLLQRNKAVNFDSEYLPRTSPRNYLI
jgi:hypothetical protein